MPETGACPGRLFPAITANPPSKRRGPYSLLIPPMGLPRKTLHRDRGTAQKSPANAGESVRGGDPYAARISAPF